MDNELSKGFTGIEINGVRFSNIREMLIYMNKQRDRIAELEAQIEQNKIDLAISEQDREHNDYELTEVYTKVEQLEKENAKLKCICRTCVYTDSPCVRSDYPSKDGMCSHYKNVFDENTELRTKVTALENANRAMIKELDDTTSGGLSVLENVVRSKEQLTKATEIIKKLMVFAEIDNREYEEAYKEAEQFLKETK